MLPLAQLTTDSNSFIFWVDRVARVPLSVVVVGSLFLTVLRVSLSTYLRRVPQHERMGMFGFVRFLNDGCDAVIYAGILVFLIVRPFGVQTFFIPSGSMIDTLLVNDYIVANKFIYRVTEPSHGDIIVFKPPKGALYAGQGETDFIKRLIGKPGDVVEWKDKKLYRNGELVDEPYVDYTDMSGRVLDADQSNSAIQANFKLVKDGERFIPVQYLGTLANQPQTPTHCAAEYAAKSEAEMVRWVDSPPAAIPAGYFLFMGDNRNGSFDGRGWGLVPRNAIIGRSEFIFLPFRRMGKTN